MSESESYIGLVIASYMHNYMHGSCSVAIILNFYSIATSKGFMNYVAI